MNSENKTNNRLISYDIIRIVAMLSVIMVHISAYIVIYFKDFKQVFITGNIFNGISRIGIPLFIMLTGALLLNEDKKFDTRRFYKKSLLWMSLLLVGWLLFYGIFYAVILPLCLGTAPSFDAFVDFLLTFKGSDYPHLWYMFMVVGLYLMIPVLRLFVKRENKNYIFGIIVVCIIAHFLPRTLDAFVSDNATTDFCNFFSKFHLEPLTMYTEYVLIGWYLTNFEIKKAMRYFVYATAVVTMPVTILLVRNDVSIRKYLYEDSLPSLICGVAVFVFIFTLCRDRKTESKAIGCLSSYGFGMYIIHVLYLEIFTQLILPFDAFRPLVGTTLMYILLSYAFVIIASFLTVAVVGKIPYLKKVFYIK